MQSRAAGTTVLLLDAPPPASATQLRAYYRRYREDLLPDIQANLIDSSPANTVRTTYAGVPTARAAERDQTQASRHDSTVTQAHAGLQYPRARHLSHASTQEGAEELTWSNVTQFDPHIDTLHYTITITLQETLTPTDGSDQRTWISAFDKIVVDTGSNTSWIIGSGYRIASRIDHPVPPPNLPAGSTMLRQMLASSPPTTTSNSATASTTHPPAMARTRPSAGMAQLTPTILSANPVTVPEGKQLVTHALLKSVPRNPPAGRIPKRVYVNHNYRKDEARTAAAQALGLQEEYADETMRIALCNYGSSSAEPTMSVVMLPSDDQTVGVRAYSVGDTTRPLVFSMQYRFAVAIGVSEGIYRAPVNGLLALGPSDMQGALSQFGNYPSFIRALMRQGTMCGTDSGQFDGFIQYYALRRRTQDDVGPSIGGNPLIQDNWLALNAWPLGSTGNGVPSWSAPIPISPLGIRSQMWITKLYSITLIELVYGVAANGTPTVTKHSRGVLQLHTQEGANNVVLDTGSTVSFLPGHVLRSLRTEIFSSSWNTAREGRISSSPDPCAEDGPQFRVPGSINLMNWRAAMAFGGSSDGGIVHVEIPCDPFIAAFDPTSTTRTYREGLIYAPSGPNAMFSILGIPFFQSAFVALHKPDTHMPPFVRIAPQPATEAELFRFALPPYAYP